MRRADIRAAVLAVEPRLRPTLLAVLQYADEADMARPSVPAVAELAGEHPGTTRRHIGELAALGALVTARRSLGGRPTVWHAATPYTGCAPGVDDDPQPAHDTRVQPAQDTRVSSSSPAHGARQPAQTQALHTRTTRGEVLKRIEVEADTMPTEPTDRPDQLPPEHRPAWMTRPDLTAPEDIPGEVAELRRRAHLNGNGSTPPPAATPEPQIPELQPGATADDWRAWEAAVDAWGAWDDARRAASA